MKTKEMSQASFKQKCCFDCQNYQLASLFSSTFYLKLFSPGDKLANANRELDDIKKVYDLTAGAEDHKNRLKTAENIRKDIENTFKTVDDANNIVQTLLTEDMQAELNEQVADLKSQGSVNEQIDEKLKTMDAFNGKLKGYISVISELETWLGDGRKRMDELLNPNAPFQASQHIV